MNEARDRWGLRLLALSLAIVVWFAVSLEKREPLSERVVDVTVTYNVSAGFIILDPLEKVRVRLRGSTSKIRSVNPLLVDAFVEIRNPEVGTREVLLGPGLVTAPEGIEVVSVDPALISLRIDREVTQLLPLEVRLEGEPAAGAVAKEPQPRPNMVKVRGPESRIRMLRSVFTTPVDLTGHALDFEAQAAVVSPDPLVKIVEPAVVTVAVPMALPLAGNP